MRKVIHSLCALAAVVIAVAGCGGSSKPGYCTDRANLNNSIRDLTNLNPSAGVSGLQTKLRTIESDATALVNSARNDFPNETSAISSSVDHLRTTVSSLPSSPSVTQIGQVVSAATAVVNSVRSFSDATSSKCG